MNYEPANARTESPRDEDPAAGLARQARTAVGLRTVLFVAFVAGALGAITGGLIVATLASGSDSTSNLTGSGESRTVSVEFTGAVADVAARARPAVVRVESATNRGSTDVGSGVIIDSRQGYILTNAHVVLRTDTLQVVLSDGTIRPAVLVGHDAPFTDVAVLQISPGGLT